MPDEKPKKKNKGGRPRKPRPEYDDSKMCDILVAWLTSTQKGKTVHAKKFETIYHDGIGKWWRQLDEQKRAKIEGEVIAQVKQDIYELYAEVKEEFRSSANPTNRKANAITLGIIITKMSEIDRLHTSFLERADRGKAIRSKNTLNAAAD